MSLANNQHIKSLKLTGCAIGNQNAALFAQNATLQDLDITNNIIFDSGAVALASMPSLTHLTLGTVYPDIGSNNRVNVIGDDGAKALANNNNLVFLSMPNNRIGKNGAIALAKNSSIKKLNVAIFLII